MSAHRHGILPANIHLALHPRLLICGNPQIHSRLRIFAALQTIWTMHPSLREDRALHRREELNLANHAVPTRMQTLAARSWPQAKLPQQRRVPFFQDLRVGDTRVGHVHVHPGLAVPGWPRAAASRDGLVVPEAWERLAGSRVGARIRAEREVVAAALGGGAGAERLEHDVGDALRGDDVAADDGGGLGRREDAGRWDADVDRGQTALVERHIGVDHAAQAVDNSRVGDGDRGVPAAVDLRAGAGEVEDG